MDEIVKILKENQIYVNSRFGSLRVSFHIYNTMEQVNIFCNWLKKFLDSSSLQSSISQKKDQSFIRSSL